MKRKPKRKIDKRVLIVEDQPETRQLYALLLEGGGFQVDTAEHAFSAVCSMVRKKPDLILMDICMPVMDGLTLVSEIRAHGDTSDIPIVAVTGLDSWDAREAAMKAGCNGYMTKPIDPARFVEDIRGFLAQHGRQKTPAKPK